ncbi:MAG: helix-turn-helix transcriptional regulator [Limnohabitans sp.]|nr:helix-turn-helix transcriptional regulator [Limnohabitans sp.]
MQLNAAAGQHACSATPCLNGQLIDIGVNHVVVNVFYLVVAKERQDVPPQPVVVIFLRCLCELTPHQSHTLMVHQLQCYLRKKLGISAAEMGQLLGVSAQSVYHWETGKTKPRASQLAAIAAVRKLGKRAVAAKLAG